MAIAPARLRAATALFIARPLVIVDVKTTLSKLWRAPRRRHKGVLGMAL